MEELYRENPIVEGIKRTSMPHLLDLEKLECYASSLSKIVEDIGIIVSEKELWRLANEDIDLDSAWIRYVEVKTPIHSDERRYAVGLCDSKKPGFQCILEISSDRLDDYLNDPVIDCVYDPEEDSEAELL